MSDYNNFNLKPLHKRMGNYIVSNTKSGGHFYLNICSYLNQYREEIPTSCLGNFLKLFFYFKFSLLVLYVYNLDFIFYWGR